MSRADGWLTIDLAEINKIPVWVTASPHYTAITLGVSAVGRTDLGGLRTQRTAVRAAISHRSIDVFRILGHPDTYHLWDGLAPLSGPTNGKWHPRFDEIAVNVTAFCQDIEAAYGTPPPVHWKPVLASPWQFLCNYALACREAWGAVQPMLGAAVRLLDREAERVGTAVVRGTMPEVLASLYPGARLSSEFLMLPARRTKHMRLARRGLAIAPILAAVERGGHAFNGDEVTCLSYPLPGIGHLLSGNLPDVAPSRGDGLVALLGPPRASLLRYLDHPATAGQLAIMLSAGQSAVTYHVDALVAAGLVERHRRGRHMLIVRTNRGDRLLDLYPW